MDGRAQRGRRLHAAQGSAHRDDPARKATRRHAGGGRDPGHAVPRAAASVPQGRQADRAVVSELQGRRARLFSPHRDLPDHARHHHPAGDRRQISLGADQPGEGVRGREEPRLSPHCQSAHGPDRVGAHRTGGAGGGARSRPLGVRSDPSQPQEPRDRAALHPSAGHDQPDAAARCPVRGYRSRRCRRPGRDSNALRPSAPA